MNNPKPEIEVRMSTFIYFIAIVCTTWVCSWCAWCLLQASLNGYEVDKKLNAESEKNRQEFKLKVLEAEHK